MFVTFKFSLQHGLLMTSDMHGGAVTTGTETYVELGVAAYAGASCRWRAASAILPHMVSAISASDSKRGSLDWV